jgi:phospholipid/cholesterol/gamma-HCH transport system substrate-binding protein
MYNKINYTLVGIFVFLFTIGLFAFGFWLSKYDVKDNYKYYKIYFSENVSGLSKDSSVKLRGVNVGKVVKISLDPKNINRVEVVVKIKKDVPIKEDMKAHLEMIGVTGLLSVVIDGGSKSSKDLIAKNGELPIIKSRPSWIDTTKDSVTNLALSLNKLLQKSESLLSSQNLENISKTLENLKRLTKSAMSIEKNTTAMIAKANKTLDEYKKLAQISKAKIRLFSKDFHAMSKNFKLITKDFHSSSKSIKPLINNIKNTSKNINRVVLKVNKGLNRGDYNLRAIFEPLTVDTRILSNQINSLVRVIRQSPNDIIFKSRQRVRGPGE